MRLPIREQLALLILLSALLGLAVLSLATWFTEYAFVIGVRSSRLAYIASLKAAQLSSNLFIMQTAASFVSSRVLIQDALEAYNTNGNDSDANWAAPMADMQAAISGTGSLGQQILLQSIVFPRDASGPGGPYGLLNVTSDLVDRQIALPQAYPNGSRVYLGDPGPGYPPDLYPVLDYESGHARYHNAVLGPGSPVLVIGPVLVNDSLSLLSITTAVINNTSHSDVLGYLTVVMDATLIAQVQQSTQGLDDTGETLIVTPSNVTNRLRSDYQPDSATTADLQVQYLLLISNDTARHPNHVVGTANPPFNASQYPAIAQAFAENATSPEASGSLIATHNEDGGQVSTGYASLDTDIVDWVVLVEQATSEVWQPIYQLRNVILACVFGTAGVLAIVAFPLAHFAVLPIRRLREATQRSVEPPASDAHHSSVHSDASYDGELDGPGDSDNERGVIARKEGFRQHLRRWRGRDGDARAHQREERRKYQFRIPGKVKERRQCVKDELSDLTTTFNEMSDELMMQYSKLEERVQQRTAELELSKKAAEAANESKTLFIANISHELKTPLNGILGMCAVCMQEDDPVRLKRELGVIYKSGDLLLNLLNDLLLFSKNQVGQYITLDEREFRLREVSTQILALFARQAKEGQIDLRVEFHGIDAAADPASDGALADVDADSGLLGAGRLKDFVLWGDVHRILQVLINLVSNSLKFTPAGGSVLLRIKCLSEVPELSRSKRGSFSSRQSKQASTRRRGSGSTAAGAGQHPVGSKERTMAQLVAQDRAPSPPPGQFLYFEFDVRDTGPGIPADQQQRVFEPFVQGDLGLSKKYGGTGLGLSICSQLATLMHGTVRVHSALGAGSTFTMKIPLRHVQTRKDSNASSATDLTRPALVGSGSSNESIGSKLRRVDAELSNVGGGGGTDGNSSTTNNAAATAGQDGQPRLVGLSQPFFATNQPMESPGSQPGAMEQIKAEASRSGRRIRVLVAEDNKVNQEVVLRMLKLEDIYDVTVASDGQMALDLVRENMAQERQPFNLIFMDIQMPNVDGLQSTRLIREMGYSAPIVALTAFAEESNMKDCIESGMNYFL